jgi:hypothetical protein
MRDSWPLRQAIERVHANIWVNLLLRLEVLGRRG